MTADTRGISVEFAALIERMSFASSYDIDNITLAGLPIWYRITLTRGLTT